MVLRVGHPDSAAGICRRVSGTVQFSYAQVGQKVPRWPVDAQPVTYCVRDVSRSIPSDGNAFRLLVQGRVVGQETNMTEDEVRALGWYLVREADTLHTGGRNHVEI